MKTKPQTDSLTARRAITGGRLAAWLLTGLLALPAAAASLVETPMLANDVEAKKLPPVAERVPKTPLVSQTTGKSGGTLRTLIGRAKDVRLLVVYGYARLVGYDTRFNIVPDILESMDVKEGRIFTFKLRAGHKWSDGVPFTTEDFRYYWEDVANNAELSPTGPSRALLVDGQPPKVEILDKTTLRYTWAKPNREFLPRLAGTSPLFIYRPAHYLKKFHKKYNAKVAQADKEGTAKRSWARVHNKRDNMYRFDNPSLPTLQPWANSTSPPADRFVAVRNPYFHRVDAQGNQLPYIDRIEMLVADGKLIPAKAGAGEADLQARDVNFNNYTFLKKAEKQNGYRTLLWRTAKGSHFALFPNLNVNDPVWRKVMRDVRFRHALSLAIDRALINNVLYFGLAIEGNNAVLPDSPLFKEPYQRRWANFDRAGANTLLDAMGLARGPDGVRRLPDGRTMEIIVETAGESTEQTDVLELIREMWREVGIKLFSKPSQREVFRNRIFSGETLMSVWSGWENGIPTADMSPEELAPTSQQQLQWPKFGQYYETSGKAGDAPDVVEIVALAKALKAWNAATTREARAAIWQRMLEIHAEQQFVIGVVSGVPQPVVVRDNVQGVPEKGIYNWDPGAFFGVYRPDTFWLR
jgi:peptide/nickel transport system substrate-binding protein